MGEYFYVSSFVAKDVVSFLGGSRTRLRRGAYENRILGIIRKEESQKVIFPFPYSTIFSKAVAAAAKPLQSCPTLCDPIDGNPPGFPIPGIL